MTALLEIVSEAREIRDAAVVEGHELVCVLEQVGGFTGKGRPGSRMFRFGENYGFIKGVIQALEIRLVLVCPQVWQKGFGLGTATACGSGPKWKNKLKAEAQRRFPQLKVTKKTEDALLILDYALAARETQRLESSRGARGASPRRKPEIRISKSETYPKSELG